jgi:hypothetical protein
MKKLLIFLLLTASLLAGCQSLGEHFNCMAEVDRTLPAQTQQRFIRTDTLCKPTFPESGTSCTSTPIYETIVLNQAQRDSAYQQCRGGINSQKLTASSNATAQVKKSPDPISPNDVTSAIKVNPTTGYKLFGKPIASALSVKRYQDTYDIYLYDDTCTIWSINIEYPQKAEIRNSDTGAFVASSCYALDKAGGFVYFSGAKFSATLPAKLFGIKAQ